MQPTYHKKVATCSATKTQPNSTDKKKTSSYLHSVQHMGRRYYRRERTQHPQCMCGQEDLCNLCSIPVSPRTYTCYKKTNQCHCLTTPESGHVFCHKDCSHNPTVLIRRKLQVTFTQSNTWEEDIIEVNVHNILSVCVAKNTLQPLHHSCIPQDIHVL